MLYKGRMIKHSSDKKYRLAEQLGAGNYGVVWKAEELHHSGRSWRKGRLVAVKFFHEDYIRVAGSAVIFEEVRRLYYSSIPQNIVVALDHKENFRDRESSVKGYIVMELMQTSLHCRLVDLRNQGKWVNLDEAKDLIRGCLNGLRLAHSQGFTHGDIKPGNVMLDATTPKLCDFGVPAIFWKGSPTFCAPEVLTASQKPDHQSDLFSIGVLAYLLLAERHPFHVDDDTCLKKEEDIIKDGIEPTPLPDTVPDRIKQVVCKLLTSDRQQRYETADQALIDLWEEPTQNYVSYLCPQCQTESNMETKADRPISYCPYCGAILPVMPRGGVQPKWEAPPKREEQLQPEVLMRLNLPEWLDVYLDKVEEEVELSEPPPEATLAAIEAIRQARNMFRQLYNPIEAASNLHTRIEELIENYGNFTKLTDACSYEGFVRTYLVEHGAPEQLKLALDAALKGVFILHTHVDSLHSLGRLLILKSELESEVANRKELLYLADKALNKALSLTRSDSKKMQIEREFERAKKLEQADSSEHLSRERVQVQ